MYERSGGSITEAMIDVIANDNVKTPHAENIIKDIRLRWEAWGRKDKDIKMTTSWNSITSTTALWRLTLLATGATIH